MHALSFVFLHVVRLSLFLDMTVSSIYILIYFDDRSICLHSLHVRKSKSERAL